MEVKMAEEGCCENGESTFNDGTHCISKTVDNGGIESKRFYLARTTAFEMLRDRGYKVPEAELSRSLSEFRSVFGEKPDLERLRICVPLCSDPKKQILVVFMGSEPITVKSVRAIHSEISNNEGLHVETFPIGDLLVNITKHIQQPKIEILTKEEKEQLLRKHALEDKQLPMHHLKKGQIIAATPSLIGFKPQFETLLLLYPLSSPENSS